MSPGCRVLAFGDALSVTFQGDLLHFPILNMSPCSALVWPTFNF